MANLAVHINDFNMATSNEETTEVELIITELPHSSEVASQSQKSNFSVEGNTFDKEMFLQALREYKCLWDTSDPNYKNRNMKVNAWNALSSLFNQEGMSFFHFYSFPLPIYMPKSNYILLQKYF